VIRSLLDSRTRLGPTIGDLVFAPIDRENISPLVVDAGARNGMYLLPQSYAERATLVGFEPNAEEYRKLTERRTDAEIHLARQGIVAPRFKQSRFHQCALWDTTGRRTLYITKGAGACTLMGEVKPFMRDTYFMYPESARRLNDKSFYDLHAAVLSTEEIPSAALDSLITDGETIDFLKIDVEGAELRVLRGADKLLSGGRILFLQSEFQVLPYYDEHPLLGDQQRYLADRGFRLIDLVFDHPRYRRGRVDIPEGSDRGMLMAGDAIFVRDPDQNAMSPLELHRLAGLSLVFWFSAFALSLLHDAGLLSASELSAIENAVRVTPRKGWRGRLLERWAKLPVVAFNSLQRAKAAAHRWRFQ
jgi:FkbM family methyltransferase